MKIKNHLQDLEWRTAAEHALEELGAVELGERKV
jgi:hypothetical protein